MAPCGRGPGDTAKARWFRSMTVDLLELDHLRARRNVKWGTYPADVVPAWIADMDFAVAGPPLMNPSSVPWASACARATAGRWIPDGWRSSTT
jgi:hypothetical protein